MALLISSAALPFWGCSAFSNDYIREAQASGPYRAIRFEPNVGQAEAGYGYVAHGSGHSIYLSSSEAVFTLSGSRLRRIEPRTIHAVLQGAVQDIPGEAAEPQGGRVNYLIGNDLRKWHTNIPTFGRVAFHGAYKGIDVVYHGINGNLENDFIVQPGADPAVIQIHFNGADEVRLEKNGTLAVTADQRTLHWQKPFIYQKGDGRTEKIEGRFQIREQGSIGFEVGVYDVHRPLVIDPLLTYATYFGGPNAEAAARVVADNNGNAYMIGATDSPNFGATPGTYVTNSSGVFGNVLVAKLSADGKTMVYETHIGGSQGDVGFGIALDATGSVYLTGMTGSADFPVFPSKANNLTTGSITDTLNCFVLKLNAAGSGLVYSTLIGGSAPDGCSGVAVDSSGNAYVAGTTASTDLPTVNAFQATAPPMLFGNASGAAFAAKLNPAGSQLLYCTYYGGPGDNAATSIAADGAGNAYFTGFTTSSSFPVSQGAFQTMFAGSGGQNSIITIPPDNILRFTVAPTFGDAFVVKLNPSGQRVYGTYLGGEKDDIGFSIAIDSQGDAYVGGATLSKQFPVQGAFQTAYKGAGGNSQAAGGDGFIAEIDPTGSKLLFSSYIGGSADDRVLGIALDGSGNIYLAGHTLSNDFPTAGQQAQNGYAGDNEGFFPTGDAFLAEVSATSHTLSMSTYLGGSAGDWAGGVAIDGLGGIILGGGTDSPDFPASTGAYQTRYGGSDAILLGVAVGDAFLAKFGGSVPAVSLSGISNAASYAGGAIAPGEAVLIAGSGIGPATLQGAALTSSGSIATQVASTQFTFNGVPAPIVFVSQQYSSVIVPYEVAGKSTAQVIATVNNQSSPPMTVNVVPALPGIFSANASGAGQGAIFNQDLTHNSAQNPAGRGSTVVLFLTGEGQTMPGGIDGAVTASQISPALSPVTVLFGNAAATNYAFIGEAPGEVAGVMQINVTIPQLAPTGGSVPVVVNVGSYSTQNGITIAIQ